MRAPLLETRRLQATTPSGRVLFEGLDIQLSFERVALVGRNGVGKSTLLEILSGTREPDGGKVLLRTVPHLVPQFPKTDEGLSPGELRTLRLDQARRRAPDLLLLDEPTQDLDEEGVAVLRRWLSRWQGGLVVASHDPSLLQDFQHFFVMAESGCRYFSGSLAELQLHLEELERCQQKRYLSRLHRLASQERHILHVARRRQRKKQYGRCRELDRATPKSTLNQKRDYAQVKHGKMKRRREAQKAAVREWARSARRALQVELPLVVPELELVTHAEPALVLEDVGAEVGGRLLFEGLDLRIGRHRLGVVGANGAGKTTLLEIMRGERPPARGRVRRDLRSLGVIAQGGNDWRLEESLVEYLADRGQAPSVVAEILVGHRFPLALAERPLRSLSPGERVRAALICLFQQPGMRLLILDEPAYCLDLVGRRALTEALRAWTGGLVVASHHRSFLEEIGVEGMLKLPTC